MGKSPFDILMESGCTGYPQAEIEKIAAVLTDAQLTEIVQRLMKSAQASNDGFVRAQKDGDETWARYYLKNCQGLSITAGLWAQAKSCED